MIHNYYQFEKEDIGHQDCTPEYVFNEPRSTWHLYLTVFGGSRLVLLWKFNSSPLRAAYMRQWTGSTLAQVMVCRCQAITRTNADLWSIGPLGTNFSEVRNSNIFIQDNVLENVVCEMTVILFRGRWVNADKLCIGALFRLLSRRWL